MMRAWIWTAWMGACATVALAAPIGDDAPVANSKEFHEALREIARVYEQFQPVDFESRWAPTFCRAPYKVDVAVARVSASKDEATHGRKVYFLFAKDRSAYRALSPQLRNEPKKKLDVWSDNKTPKLKGLGQIVVKQSWQPEEIKPGAKLERKPGDNFGHVKHASFDGKQYRIGKQTDLFIMYKAAPKTTGTDSGWVYGTVTSDGKTVTSAGRVASCMNCHKEAKHDRLFGLAPVPAHGPAETK